MKTLLIDWGIGGLSVYRELKAEQPNLSVVYISDSGNTPYGKLPADKLGERLRKLVEGARETWGIEQTVIACNAASTVLDEVSDWAVPIFGVIEPGLRLVRESGAKRVGVIGGLRTIESRIFSSGLKHLEVKEEVAQPLSALIERGVLSGAELECALKKILKPLTDVEVLLMACTHYPAVAGEIQKIIPNVKLLDPARETALEVMSGLKIETRGAGDEFYTSGDAAQMEAAGEKAFGIRFRAQKLPQAFLP